MACIAVALLYAKRQRPSRGQLTEPPISKTVDALRIRILHVTSLVSTHGASKMISLGQFCWRVAYKEHTRQGVSQRMHSTPKT